MSLYRPFLAYRFIRSRIIVWLGILSIAAAVAVFVVVMGVLEGFSEQLRDMVRRTTSHVEISRPYVGGLSDWEAISEIAERHPQVTGTTPYVQGPALMQSQKFRFYGFIKGVAWKREREFGHIAEYVRIPLSVDEIRDRSGLDYRTVETSLGRLIAERAVQEVEGIGYDELYQRCADEPVLNSEADRKVFGVLKEPPEKIEYSDDFAPPGIPAIIVGDRIWTEMDLRRGELIRVSVQAGDEGDMVKRLFVVMGEFKTGSQLFDHWALTGLEGTQELFGMDGNIHGLGIWLKDYRKSGVVKKQFEEVFGDPAITGENSIAGMTPGRNTTEHRYHELLGPAPLPVIKDKFPGEYRVRSWMEQQQDLFKAIAIENKIMRLILILFFLLIGVFILSTMYVMVTEKVRDIGILMAIGARVRGVMGLFLSNGLFVGITGTALGLLAGLALALNVNEVTQALHLNIFPEDIFKVERIPVSVLPFDVVLVSIVAVGTSLLASVYPAYRAARMNPVESLRHE